MNKRILSATLAIALAAAVFPVSASGETEAQLKARLEQLKRESARAGRSFDAAYWKLDETETRLARTNKRLAQAERRLKAAKKRLNRQANSIYRREGLDMIEFLVGSASFDEFVTRFDFLSRVGSASADLVAEIKVLTAELRETRAELQLERRRRRADVAALRSRRDALQRRLRATEAEFKAVKARLDAVRSNGRVPQGVAAVPGPNGMVFPVVGSYYYADTWGASRSGGRRRHQGTDIMAPTGTPVVAILSGTVRAKSNRLGGNTIWLHADNGWSFYYAHLSSYVVTSGRVRAGQVIGRVGYSGNAAASAPHLHLQIHPGGGGPVNPYPYLRAME